MASSPPGPNSILQLVESTLNESTEGVELSTVTEQRWRSLSASEQDLINQLHQQPNPQLSHTSAQASSLAAQPSNPVYLFVKAIIDQQSEQRSLAEITHQIWKSISSPAAQTLFTKLSLGTNFAVLSEYIRTTPSPLAAYCTVVSSQVFLYQKGVVTIPAEIGIAKFSFLGPQLKTYREFFKIREETLEAKYMTQVTKSIEHHKIPIDFPEYKDITQIIEDIHELIHQQNGLIQETAWVFVNDSEFYQTKSVIEWIAHKSRQHRLPLSWKVKCVSISALVNYLKVIFRDPSIACDLSSFNFATFDPSFQCPVHTEPHHAPVCALSNAHYHSQVLKQYFGPVFESFQ